MNVYKRCTCADPCEHVYHFEFRHRGRQHRETTHTANHKLAGRIAERRQREIVGRAAGVSSASDPSRVRLSTLRAQYDEWVTGAHRHPYEAQQIIHRFCAFFTDDPFVADITPFDLERYRSHRLKTCARSTVHSQFGIVQGMLRQAAIWYPGLHRPDAGVSKWRPDEAEIAILTPEEIRYTLTELPPILALICRVTLETLARLHEVLGLTIHDVGPKWMTRRLKGGRRLRIEITPALAAALRAPLRPGQVHLFEVPIRGGRGRPAVWRPLTRAQASARFTAWFRQHALRHLHHHCYRHTGISLMLDGGTNPKAIQQLAGWTSLAMLPRYGHVGNREMQRAPAPVAPIGASGAHKNAHTAEGHGRN
jgi:integrase